LPLLLSTRPAHVSPALAESPIGGDSPKMHSHLQGVFLLLIACIGLLVAANYARPVLSEALGDNGAIVATPSEETDELPTVEREPLSGEEILRIQGYLARLGHDPGEIDGYHGPNTAAAIDEAIEEYRMPANSADRDVLEYLQSLIDGLEAAEVGLDPDLESGADQQEDPSGE